PVDALSEPRADGSSGCTGRSGPGGEEFVNRSQQPIRQGGGTMKPLVYIADLRYNYAGVLANDCMPLGVAYMKAVMDRDVPEVEPRLFAYPDQLSEAIQQRPPDVLMVSNYVWNEQLSLHFLRLLKEIRPQSLTVMGGPNISIEADRQIAWFSTMPFIDLYVLG